MEIELNGINLGDRVKDRISGFTGIAYSKYEWLNKCKRIDILPETFDKDGKVQDSIAFDDVQVELVEAGVVVVSPNVSTAQIALGDRVKDRVTGFIGIADGYLDGVCGLRVRILPEVLDKEGSPAEATWFWESQVELVDAGAIVVEKNYTGGPRDMGNLNLNSSPAK